MTLPRVVRDLLMLAPSLRRWPVAPVELARSEPAKSTRLRLEDVKIRFDGRVEEGGVKTDLIRETFSVSRFVSLSCRFIVRRRVKTACEREELKEKQRKVNEFHFG